MTKRMMISIAAFFLGVLTGICISRVPRVHAQEPSATQDQMNRDMARLGSQLKTGNQPVRVDAIEADTITGGVGFTGKDVLGFSCLPLGGRVTCFVLSRQP